MSIYALKSRFQALLRPLVQNLFERGVTANQVTIAALLGSLVLAALLAWLSSITWVFILVPLWMFIRMALNAIDGMLAREHGQQSALGGYLNELSDMLADAALYAPFALLSGVYPSLVVVFIIFALLSEAAGILGVAHGNGRRYDGPMGKSDRAFLIGLIAVLVVFHALFSIINGLFFIGIGLLLITNWRRVSNGLAG
ncbi:CDP-alcohol phosphatidyltransferase family protein [Suttonella sp. R2A3]|uniref:CDP-alcohol phosphatidyltransferase family protein n=1 Tax=Suttonella sp. R2A3 TaxID=2908648 RepID=UPI001F321EFE|nr:CDP-alcohol phosphatidyltransferase family protein [Suttonella sp. R2A3]UJF24905.1 CDP-alcohol phosphatidyltransferase family protein [Suttonella sp. R2A3]